MATDQSEDERAIRQMVERWIAATKSHDLPSRLAMLAEDVVFMTPGREPFGKQAFAELADQMRDVAIDSRVEITEIFVCGDSAWYRSHIDVMTTAPGKPTSRRSGFAMTIARRSPDGWVIARDANLVQ